MGESARLCDSGVQCGHSTGHVELHLFVEIADFIISEFWSGCRNVSLMEVSWTALLSDGKRCFFGPSAQPSSWPGVKPREMVTPIINGPTARPFIKLPGRWPCSNLRISSPGLRPRRGKLLDLWSAICGFKTTNWRCPISHYSETPCFRRKTQNVSPLRMMEPLSSWQYAGTNAKGLPTNAR